MLHHGSQAQGNRNVSTCLESVVKQEARVFDMSKNETIRNYAGKCFLWYRIVSMSSVNQ